MKSQRRSAIGLAGVAATALLHFLIFTAAVWGGRHPVRPPDAVGAGANSGKAHGETAERRMYVQLNVVSDNSLHVDQPQPALPEADLRDAMLQITGPDALKPPPLEFEKEGEATEASDAELMAMTRMAGIYQSQIRARIERAWTVPKEASKPRIYSCQVKITQRRDGRIEDVKLEHCEGSFPWMDSLVNAIYSASPLPGPPHPSVFVDTFSLTFRSGEERANPVDVSFR